MKRLLLLLGAAALLVAAPAMAQYVYLDTNGDGVCSYGSEFLSSSTTSVDIYFDTNHNRDGSTVTCPDGPPSTLDIFSYGFCLRASGPGSVTYGTYTDAMAAAVPGGFTTKIADVRSGGDLFAAYGGTVAGAEGRYKVGSLAVVITGSPVLTIIPDSPIDPGAVTVFGTSCSGPSFDGSYILGRDFTDNCGTNPQTPTRSTTWGAIKNLYR